MDSAEKQNPGLRKFYVRSSGVVVEGVPVLTCPLS